MPQWSIYEWIEKLRNGRTSVTREGAGCPSTATTDDNIERMCDMVFSEGMKKLVQRWKKCIEKQGGCDEKWCYSYYNFSIYIEIKFVSVVWIIID